MINQYIGQHLTISNNNKTNINNNKHNKTSEPPTPTRAPDNQFIHLQRLNKLYKY